MVWGSLFIALIASSDPSLAVETLVPVPPAWLEGASLSWVGDTWVVHLAEGAELGPVEYDHTLATLLSVLDTKSRRPTHIELRDSTGRVLVPPSLDEAQVEVLSRGWLDNRATDAMEVRSGVRLGALSGKRIVLSAGHGINWYDDEGRWRFQRGELHDLREDLHCNQIVAHHLAPMLEAAGADVVLVRERSSYPGRVVVDNDAVGTTEGAYGELGSWQVGASSGRSGSYRVASVTPDGQARATWTFSVSQARDLPVYVWFKAGSNRARTARYEVDHAGGTTIVLVDQQRDSERWRYLGTFGFAPGMPAAVHLTNIGSEVGSYVVADSIRLGGGTGFVDYGTGPSGELRWRQSAKSHALEDEIPESVRAGRGDVSVRPSVALWQGADLYFALHTNAGGGRGTSSFVYSNAVAYPGFDPNRATSVPPGTLALQDAVHQKVIETVRAYWKSDWSDRGTWGANFGELRPITQAWQADASVEVPAMLIEVAFHDSEDDTVYLREERFRQDVARAIMQGMIAFVHADDEASRVTPPVPPTGLHIEAHRDGLMVRWSEGIDSLDATARAEHYTLEISTDGVTFGPPHQTADTHFLLEQLVSCETLAIRVRAANAGGSSMPSKVLIARPRANGPRVLWVDGVRRVVRTVLEGPEAPRHGAWMLKDLSALRRSDLHVVSTHASRVADGTVVLTDFDLVIWSAGETSTRDVSLLAEERGAIEAFVDHGGSLILSGAEIGWDLVAHGDEDEQLFFHDVLRAEYVADASGTFNLETSDTSVLVSAVASLNLDDGTKGRYRVEYPDVLSELYGSQAELLYEGGGIAALSSVGVGGIFLAGFPLETVLPDDGRQALLESVIDGLLGPEQENPDICGRAYPDAIESVQPRDIVMAEPHDLVRAPHVSASDGVTEQSSEQTFDRESSGCGCSSGASPIWLFLMLFGALSRALRQ